MRAFDSSIVQALTLEAPGDFLSELLSVSDVRVLSLLSGSVHELPEEYGVWRILSALEGRLRVTAGDLSFPLEPGQAAAVDGRDELVLLPGADCRLCILSLRGSIAERVFHACRTQGGLFFSRGGAAVEQMLRVLSANTHRAFPAQEASAHAYSLLMSLYGTGSADPEGQRMLPQVVEASLGIIRREYAFLEGIAELATRLEVSQEYLTRCFCKYTGITPGKYLNQVRIENAKLLLRQGRHSITFVSDACGFANANYFARVFRRSVGVNPRDYARMHGSLSEKDSGEDSLYVL